MSRRRELQEESIYNLIPEPVITVPKGPLYRSKFPKKAEPRALPGSTFVTVKKERGTMGPLKVKPPKEEEILKKRQKEPKLPPAQKFSYNDETRKPAVVKRSEKPVMGLVTKKNFIASNAAENILAPAVKPVDNQVDFLQKPDYGQVPAYLDRVKAEIEDEYRYIRELQQDEPPGVHNGMRLLPEEERLQILEGLKQKWGQLNTQYQTMSFTVDTIAKRRRKEQYERELAELERDIERMSKQFVYVAVE